MSLRVFGTFSEIYISFVDACTVTRDRPKFGFGFGYSAETGYIFSCGYGRYREARFRFTFGYARNYDKVSA